MSKKLPCFLKQFLFLITATVVFSSCVSYERFPIQLLQPSKRYIPEAIQSFTVVNRAVNNEFKNHVPGSLQRELKFAGHETTYYVNDSLAADTCVKAMAQLLYESGQFDVVIPGEYTLDHEQATMLLPQPLSWEYVGEICDVYETDALISLELFNTAVITKYDEFQAIDTNYKLFDAKYVSLDVACKAYWRIYDPRQKKVIDEYLVKDTIFWDGAERTTEKLARKIPLLKDALLAAGIYAAMGYVDSITPQWENHNRIFFSKGGRELEGAASLAREGKWDEAEVIWQKNVNTKSKALRSKTEFNMALAAEMRGDIDEALKWAQKSYQTSYRNQTAAYIKTLNNRLLKLKEIVNNEKNRNKAH